VGAGKTLGMSVVAHALNFLVRRDVHTAAPRVDRMLVLTKEVGIRDQIVDDLLKDLTRFGILSQAPRVRCVKDYKEIVNAEIVATADIWVSCIQMFYEERGGMKPDIERVLAQFPLICLDEPHWATEQALNIVDTASRSLCFGFTGTPIDTQGAAINRFVLVSLFRYQDAVEYDGSLKYVSDDGEWWPELLEIVGIEEADVLEQGRTRTTTAIEPEHIKNIAPVRTVAERVVLYMRDCDFMVPHEAARHRRLGAVPDLLYPMHAIICVDRVSMARALAKFLNDKFAHDPGQYPQEKGWHAEVIHSWYDDNAGQRSRGQRMHPEHAWLRCYKQGGVLDVACSRVLIVVGMGREGLNNPFCGVYGLTSHVNSAIFIVQATLGRTLRSVTEDVYIGQERELHVPPARLDIPRIITHVAAQNEQIVHRGVEFILHMDDHLEAIPTMDDLMADRVFPSDGALNPDVIFTQKERYDVAAAIGKAKEHGTPLNVEELLAPFHTAPPEKQERVRNWIDLVDHYPADAAAHLYHQDTLTPAYIVTRELPNAEATNETLRRYIRREHPDLVDALLDFDHYRRFFLALYQQYARQFHLGRIMPQTKLSTLSGQFAGQLHGRVKELLIGEQGLCFKAINIAMRAKLGVPRDVVMRNGSEWDRAECHVILQRDEVRREILGFAMHWLIKHGYCPTLAAAFQVRPCALDEDEVWDDAL
jgi:type III restriction/modification enzyme restriction subunit